MATEEIEKAGNTLEQASHDVDGEAARRLREQGRALLDLSEGGNEPDHGRVARHQQKLKDLKADHDETADAVDEANDLLNQYRETIEGV